MKITTTTGVILDTEYGMTSTMNDYVKEKGSKNGNVFYVEENSSYLLVINGTPVLESGLAETILARIDFMSLL